MDRYQKRDYITWRGRHGMAVEKGQCVWSFRNGNGSKYSGILAISLKVIIILKGEDSNRLQWFQIQPFHMVFGPARLATFRSSKKENHTNLNWRLFVKRAAYATIVFTLVHNLIFSGEYVTLVIKKIHQKKAVILNGTTIMLALT